MSQSPEHPSGWTLELYAEEALGGEESAAISTHLQQCSLCSSEVDSLRTLFEQMSGLPRFSPSPGFEEAVMARVRITPKHAPIYSWLLRWLPATRRGWTLLLGLAIAPALPVLGLVAWLVTNPMVTAGGLWELATERLSDVAWSTLVAIAGGIVESDAVANAQLILSRLLEVPTEILLGAGLLVGVGVPLSAWILYRTLRTPTRGSMYAH